MRGSGRPAGISTRPIRLGNGQLVCLRVAFVLLVSIALCISCAKRTAFSGRELRIGYDDSPPYTLIGPDGSPRGFAVELITEAARRRAIRLQWVKVERSLYRIEKGETRPEDLLAHGVFDLWPVAGVAQERLAHFHIGKPWLQNYFFLVSKKARPITTVAEAGDKTIIHFDGPLAKETSERLLKKSKLVGMKGFGHIVAQVCNGNADAAFVEGRTLETVLFDRPDDCSHIPLKASLVPNSTTYAGIEARREFTAEADALSDEILSMASDGTFAKAVDKWSSFSATETRSLIALQQANERNQNFYRERSLLIAACVLFGLIAALAFRSRASAERARSVEAGRAEALRQLMRANERVSLAARAGGVGIWEYDLGNEQLIWDDQMCRLYGITADTFSGAYEFWQSRVHPNDRQRAHEEIQAAIQGTRDFDTEFRVVWSDRSIHNIRALALVKRDASGRALNIIGTNWDITEQKKAADKLLNSNQQLEKATILANQLAVEAASANAAKSEFLANMSHEIRTPMNGVLGMLDLAMADDEICGVKRDYLETAKSSATLLLTVINDILDFSRMEAGKLQVDPVPSDVRQHVSTVMKAQAAEARRKGLTLTWSVAPDVPTEFITDPIRLNQILTNLVGNAIKFTSRGGVEVRVGMEEPARAGAADAGLPVSHMLHFSVKDTGIGIPEDRQSRIFEAFSQADSSTTRLYGGTGLGLAICSRLVRLLGGDLRVESQTGRGSLFHFTIGAPAGTPAAGAGSTSVISASKIADDAGDGRPYPTPASPLRILLAEDNAVNQMVAQGLLQHRNHIVKLAATGKQALAALQSESFDLILMDAQMPEMDGFEATREIRRREGASGFRIPIIALTAHAMSGDRERCIEAGMDGYCSKPIRGEELFKEIDRVLSLHSNSRSSPLRPDLAWSA